MNNSYKRDSLLWFYILTCMKLTLYLWKTILRSHRFQGLHKKLLCVIDVYLVYKVFVPRHVDESVISSKSISIYF